MLMLEVLLGVVDNWFGMLWLNGGFFCINICLMYKLACSFGNVKGLACYVKKSIKY